MIIGAPLARAPAVGRERDQDVAEDAGAEPERAVAQIGIAGRLAPSCANSCDGFGRQACKQRSISVERSARVNKNNRRERINSEKSRAANAV